jgi:hypothetical protein
MMTDRELQSLRNQGNECEAAADEIERLRALLVEACALFRIYEESHRAKGAGHEKKVERNADIAGRIEAALEA